MRFRSYRVPLTADIEKAFLMISIVEHDRDVLRFLWYDDLFLDQPTMIELRFTRVVFGVSSSPFLLNATIKHHLEMFYSSHPKVVSSILQSIYVDDVVFGADDEESAYRLYQESKDILKRGSFNLRKFTTSCPSLRARIEEAEGNPQQQTDEALDETFAKSTLGGAQPRRTGEQKIFGVCWDIGSDCFLFNLRDIAEMATNQQREMLLVWMVASTTLLGFCLQSLSALRSCCRRSVSPE